MNFNAIKKITLNNFKNFKDIEADFSSVQRSDSKHVAYIYGGNAVGKSNLTSSLIFLSRISYTLYIHPHILREITRSQEKGKWASKFFSELKDILEKDETNISLLIKDFKRYGSETENMYLKYEFEYNGTFYEYEISTDDEKIVLECLKAREKTRIAEIFSYSDEKGVYFSKQHFKNDAYARELGSKFERKGRKHTIVAVINEEIRVNDKDFTSSTFSKTLLGFLSFIDSIDVLNQDSMFEESDLFNDNTKILPNILSGELPLNDKSYQTLKLTEKFLEVFYLKYFNNIKEVEYLTKENENKLKYKLAFKRLNAEGKLISIVYSEESFGIQAMSCLISNLYYVLMGKIIVLDDINLGLNEQLAIDVLNDFSRLIEKNDLSIMTESIGQLFIVTQNLTFLLKDNKYNVFFLENKNGEADKSDLIPLSSLSRIVQGKSNVRSLYLAGKLFDKEYTVKARDLSDLSNILKK